MVNIIEEFRKNKNLENAEKQAAYLRHQFEFIGLKTPERRLLGKEFIKEKNKVKKLNGILLLNFGTCLNVNFNIWRSIIFIK